VSLESGRKYGFVASIINVIMPVVTIVLFVSLLMYAFANLFANSSQTFSSTALFVAVDISIAVIAISGLILFLLAMYRLSKYYAEPAIFKNVLYAFIINIAVAIIGWIIFSIYISSIIGQIPSGGINTTATTTPNASALLSLIFGFLIFAFVAFIFFILCAVLYWRAFNKLAEKSQIDDFKTAGLLYLLGTVLMIILVGAILIWVAWIYAAQGFHKLKPKPSLEPPIATPYTLTPTPNVTNSIYCANCGAENSPDAIYCKNCGKLVRANQTNI
jgi:uncharacterized membrane protein